MIELSGIRKNYSSREILRGVNLHVEKGDVISLIGPSGAGKTTLLRCINLLEKPEQGKIIIGDISIDCAKATKKETLAVRRKTAMVFQNYNLFKNKTALENVTEGLIMVKNIPRYQAEKIGLRHLDSVGLANKAHAYPHQLSGGQQQRVAISRAVALNPEVILFDEPTSALDPELVGEVLSAIKTLAQSGITMIIVTHEISFARNVSNRVIFMDDGAIVEQGNPNSVILDPKKERTQQFLCNFNKENIYTI